MTATGPVATITLLRPPPGQQHSGSRFLLQAVELRFRCKAGFGDPAPWAGSLQHCIHSVLRSSQAMSQRGDRGAADTSMQQRMPSASG